MLPKCHCCTFNAKEKGYRYCTSNLRIVKINVVVKKCGNNYKIIKNVHIINQMALENVTETIDAGTDVE